MRAVNEDGDGKTAVLIIEKLGEFILNAGVSFFL